MTRLVLQNTEVANNPYSNVETSFHNQQMEAQIKTDQNLSKIELLVLEKFLLVTACGMSAVSGS